MNNIIHSLSGRQPAPVSPGTNAPAPETLSHEYVRLTDRVFNLFANLDTLEAKLSELGVIGGPVPATQQGTIAPARKTALAAALAGQVERLDEALSLLSSITDRLDS